jgi:ABC-type glutathione transport system ATPase component
LADLNEPLLEILGLQVDYRLSGGQKVRALKRISLSVHSGESIAIVGQSGSGKSTLARAILQLLPQEANVQGKIRFRGQDLASLSRRALQRHRGARISMIFQHPQAALNPLMRAGRQVAEVIRAHHRFKASECHSQARSVLRQVFDSNLDRIFEQYPHELSGGECQRVCIAQALACRPELLIADEPTAMLDTEVQAGVLRIFHRLRQASNLSLVLITHNPSLLPGLVDRTVILEPSDD